MRCINKAYAWFRIVRPPIVIISILGSFVGLYQADPAPPLQLTLMVAMGASTLSAGLMVHNDVTDYQSDKHNRPWKPLPAGAISLRTAEVVGLGLMGAAVVIAFFTVNLWVSPTSQYRTGLILGKEGINAELGLLTATITAVGIHYNKKGKQKGIWGHMMVAYGVAAIPLYGATAAGVPWAAFPLVVSLFIMEIGREIMVCVQDIEGDRAAGYSTYPIQVGPAKAKKAALLFYLGFLSYFPLAHMNISPYSGIFGLLAFSGAVLFMIILLTTWLATLRTDSFEKFEIFIRTGTRAGVIFFQILLLIDALIFSPFTPL